MVSGVDEFGESDDSEFWLQYGDAPPTQPKLAAAPPSQGRVTATEASPPRVGLVVSSRAEISSLEGLLRIFKDLSVRYEVGVGNAMRAPREMREWLREMRELGV